MTDRRATDYALVAPHYDTRYLTFDFGEIEASIGAFLGEHAGALLDVGCGTGHWLAGVGKRARFAAGIDLSLDMLQRAPGAVRGRLVQGRAEQLPWPDATFDRLLCVNALHHLSSRDAFFSEALRVLKPGGALLTVGLDPHAERDDWWVYDYFPETRPIDLARYPAVRTIRAELVRAGFSWSESFEAQRFETQMTAGEAQEKGLLDRRFTSQLTVLSDDEYAAGISRIVEAMAGAATRGDELVLSSDLHLFATSGWK